MKRSLLAVFCTAALLFVACGDSGSGKSDSGELNENDSVITDSDGSQLDSKGDGDQFDSTGDEGDNNSSEPEGTFKLFGEIALYHPTLTPYEAEGVTNGDITQALGITACQMTGDVYDPFNKQSYGSLSVDLSVGHILDKSPETYSEPGVIEKATFTGTYGARNLPDAKKVYSYVVARKDQDGKERLNVQNEGFTQDGKIVMPLSYFSFARPFYSGTKKIGFIQGDHGIFVLARYNDKGEMECVHAIGIGELTAENSFDGTPPDDPEYEWPEYEDNYNPETPDEEFDFEDIADFELAAIEDENLERCIRDNLKKSEGEITKEEYLSILHLECQDYGIKSIKGIENLRALRTLSLWENEISDIAQLGELKRVSDIELGNNNIADISVLSGLQYLVRVGLSHNLIDSVEPLKDQIYLWWLNVDSNKLSDISPLEKVTSLHYLSVEKNTLPDTLPTVKKLRADGCDVYADDTLKRRSSAGLGYLESRSIPGLPDLGFRYPVKLDYLRSLPRSESYGDSCFDLDPFVMASPNQMDAGSCLFMANSGSMEVLLNQHFDGEILPEGDTDLSERFLMNASEHVTKGDMPYHLTDLIYTYNVHGGSLLNRDYRYTSGFIKPQGDSFVPAEQGDEGAYLSLKYNWLDELPEGWKDSLTETPEVDRTLIYVDPDKYRWNVGIMNEDMIERVKYQVRVKNSPVVVVYNHFNYWHAVMIVGYDDADSSQAGCPFVTAYEEDLVEQWVEAKKEGDEENAAGIDSLIKKIEKHKAENGGCRDKGIFYVRDSIYPGDEKVDGRDNTYDYNPDINGDEEPYSRRIVKHSYDWLKYLGNHAYVIHRK